MAIWSDCCTFIISLSVLTYFVPTSYCTVVFYDHELTNDSSPCDRHCQLLDAVDTALLEGFRLYHPVMWISAELDSAEQDIRDAVEYGCQSYIVVSQQVMQFFDLKLVIKETTLQRMRDRNFLILDVTENLFDADSWTTKEAFKFYPNLWLLSPRENGSHEFYTQDYSNSYVNELQLATTWNSSSAHSALADILFHDKLYDLQGRTIPMGVAEYAPYCMTTNVGAGNGNADAFNSTAPKELYVEGLEGSQIVEFCHNRNCNIKLWPYGPSDWGDIFENGSGYGEIYSTYMKETEFATCCLYYNWYLHLLDGSQYVAKSTITVLVPGAKVLPTSLTLIYPFENTLWMAIVFMLVLMTAVHHMITALDPNSPQPPFDKSIFDIISIYLDQGVFPNSHSSAYRFLVSFILLSGVVLSNSYTSGFASVLTIPRYGKSIETIHDFVQTPYRWGAPAIAWVLSLFGADSHDIQTVVRKFDMTPDEEQLYRRSLSGTYGLGVELLNGGNFAFGSFIREDNVRTFEILKQELYYTYTIGYAQRGWPLMEYYNKFNLESIQHGFLIYWEGRTARKWLNNRIQQALMEISAGRNEGEELAPLTVQYIVGPLWVLAFGLSAAFGMFVCEIGWKKLTGLWRKITLKRANRRLFDFVS
ncbi:uncharacterized protein LOC120423077 [Culex pipiens pallens]|uniref:uncharacterized protein LOC120423077 n=1 Tax=Culex pipiens pallens TaxID=42434 RepID=UPI0019543AA7|nr:uncharacterized protein LOC120423077 [Culex pipiens pallens]